MMRFLFVAAAEWVTPSLQEKIAKNPGLLQSEDHTVEDNQTSYESHHSHMIVIIRQDNLSCKRQS